MILLTRRWRARASYHAHDRRINFNTEYNTERIYDNE